MPQQHLSTIGYAAQAILARRDHSEAELARKLAAKGYASADIAAAIAKLKKIDLVNDRAYASRYAASLLTAKPVGPRLVAVKLRGKGIAASLADEVLQEVYTPGREEELAQAAVSRWQRTRRLPATQADRARLARHLAARGFSSAVISAALAASTNGSPFP